MYVYPFFPLIIRGILHIPYRGPVLIKNKYHGKRFDIFHVTSEFTQHFCANMKLRDYITWLYGHMVFPITGTQ